MTNPDNDEILAAGKFLQLRRRGTWEIADRINSRMGVVVIAVTRERELLLVEQFRIPVDCNVIEFPAGIVGDDADKVGEEAGTAALRELQEETGYANGEMRFLMCGPTSPGLTSEVVALFLATGLERVADGGGVDGENITLHRVPLAALETWLEAKAAAGCMIDPKVYLSLYFTRDL
jgi:ADP-ribose pyrophosphatase